MWLGLAAAAAVIILDQITKYWVLSFLGVSAYIPFGDYFNLVRAWNTGVSFSMLNDYGNMGAWLLSGLAVVIVIMLFFWLRKENSRVIQAALGMIMGGAVGNVSAGYDYGRRRR